MPLEKVFQPFLKFFIGSLEGIKPFFDLLVIRLQGLSLPVFQQSRISHSVTTEVIAQDQMQATVTGKHPDGSLQHCHCLVKLLLPGVK